jgi:hypothetical protein
MLANLSPRDQTEPARVRLRRRSLPRPGLVTAAVGDELDRAVRTINATLDLNRQPALQRLTRPPVLPQKMPDSLRLPAQARHRDAALASNVGRRRHP